MTHYVLRRLISIPLLLLGVATVAFFLSHFTQADPLSALVSERQMNNPEVVAAAKQRWGLDRSRSRRFIPHASACAYRYCRAATSDA
jgi:ABC-type dipeptide/oligopeptide/nickel transport system permease component